MMVRLKRRLHIGNTVWYAGDVVDLDKHPEVAAALRARTVRAPVDRMMRPERGRAPGGYVTK